MKKEIIVGKKMKSKYVLLNNKGYTLLECIMGMFVLSFVIIMLMFMIQVMHKNNVNNYFNRNITSLVNTLESDFLSAKKADVKLGILDLEVLEENKTISYVCSTDKLVRRVNYLGGETVISDLDSCHIFNKDDNIFVKLKYKDKVKEIYVGKAKM